MSNQECWRPTQELKNRDFQPNGCCYFGCGQSTNNYFASGGGHDRRFDGDLLAFLRDNSPDAIDMAIQHLVGNNP